MGQPTMTRKTLKQITVPARLLLILLLTACIPGSQAAVRITGAVERDLSNAQVFYEETPSGRQIYLHQVGPGQDLMVLDVSFPGELAPAPYPVTSNGPVSASYYEYVNDVSRRFDAHVQGTLTVHRADDRFSGELALSALPATGDAEPIGIIGSFRGIPFNRAGTLGPQAVGTLLTLVLMVAFGVLLVINLGLQFYIGRRVYGTDGGWAWRSLRGTRTFIRGWRDADQRSVMTLWSLALVTLLLCILFLVMLQA
jgi:hypothetical protein